MARVRFNKLTLRYAGWISIAGFCLLILWLAVPDCDYYNNELLNVYTTIYWPRVTQASQQTTTLCLLTQLTYSRVDRLQKLAQHWKGPISAAIYVPKKHLDHYKAALSKWISISGRINIALALVVENGTLYPVNHLRNIAISNSLAKYILTVDVDFLPNKDLYRNILRLLKTGFLKDNKKALVVPAFELLKKSRFPATKADVIRYYKEGTLVSFHDSYFPSGHGPSQADIWVHSDTIYQVSYKLGYEPYVVISRKHSPLYSELFIQRFFNKASHIYELYYTGWSFFVMPDGYLVHAAHKYEPEKSAFMYRCAKLKWMKFQISLSFQKRTALEYLL